MTRGPRFEVVATGSHTGQRADRVLAELLQAVAEGVSRGAVQRSLEAGTVLLDGAPIGSKHKVKAGQRFVVELEPPPPSEALPEADVAFTLVHVDDDLIVIDKPAGLVVHPAPAHPSGTLVNGLLGRGLLLREQLGDDPSEEEHDRPGIVHRIDKDTSGLLVVARTAAAREGLKRQFAAHDLERSYEAIAVGRVPSATISTLHGRHPTERVKFSSRVREGKRAVTHIELLHAFGVLASHVRCRLETGRTHQIRVHLADQGTPLLGDSLYGKALKDPRLLAASAAIGRQALHARTLGFVHPRTGAALRFESPLPAEFVAALAALAAAEGAR